MLEQQLKQHEPTTPPLNAAGPYRHGNEYLIELRQVVKTFPTAAGPFTALKNIDLKVNSGEFVAVIGKSGSGKTTLVNMISGIDRPTSGEVLVGDTAVHTLSENQMAKWRGHNLGIVFQFFQLLPTLSLAENVMLPMDFRNVYSTRQRKDRAMHLLELVGMAEQANRLPSAISGGQQQRIAIARALANDPPIVLADEPTGNLDSSTSESVFQLFEGLVASGKTILVVTHDSDLAKRVRRAVIVSDGQVIDEYLARTFPALTEQQLVWITRELEPQRHEPGAVIIREGVPPDNLYLVTRGRAEVMLKGPEGQDIVVAHMDSGQYFGEIAMMRGGSRTATVRAALATGIEVAAIDRETFDRMIAESEPTREAIERIVDERLARHESIEHTGAPHPESRSPTLKGVPESEIGNPNS